MGRAPELAELARALDTGRLVTVTGTGGVGKSRLAARAAARRSPRHGVWRGELAPVRDEEFVDYAVVEALGLVDHTTRLPRETLLAHLAERELLLVLDGVEHVVEACASLTAELLGRAPGCGCWRWAAGRSTCPGSGWSRWRRCARRRRWSCWRSGPGSGSWLPGTATTPWARTGRRCASCACAWTGFRWRSSWRRAVSAHCRRGRCCSAWTTASAS